MARAALPAALICQEPDLIATAGWAGNAIRPALRYEVREAIVIVRENLNGFLESLGIGNGYHGRIIADLGVLVKYIFTKTF